MEKSKKFISFFTALILLLMIMPFPAVYADDNTPIDTYSECVYMVNTDTGTVVYEKNAHKQTYPASLTKIMTAIVAIEYAQENNLDMETTMIKSPAYIYDELVNQNASTADIRPGETVSFLDLLYALMLPSSCEAGSIIADYVGDGDISAFIDMMNAEAKKLGANDTNFENAHGLTNYDQVSTVYDFYLICTKAMSIPLLATICDTSSYEMPKTSFHKNGWTILNTNSFVRKGGAFYDENVHGIKTGALDEVGKNLCTTLSQDGYNYMLVTMGAPNKDSSGKTYATNRAFEDAKNLYAWAISSFKISIIAKKGEIVAEAPVSLSMDTDHVQLTTNADITALIPTDSDETGILKKITLAQDIAAPISQGAVLGRMDLLIKNEVIASVELVAASDVEQSVLLYSLDATGRFISQPIIVAFICALILLILLLVVFVLHHKKVKRAKSARHRFKR